MLERKGNWQSEKTYSNSPPMYSYPCDCGITIAGQSEKGLNGLLKRHIEDAIFHTEKN